MSPGRRATLPPGDYQRPSNLSLDLHSVLTERTDEEKALTRKHIQSGDASLHLPLSAHAEFDA